MINKLKLKYGLNPYQSDASVFMRDGSPLPFSVLNGSPGYINLLDALNSWQLVRELRNAFNTPAAASFKHVSPAGAAISGSISEAYRRARECDSLSSYGDFAALSDTCDEETAGYLRHAVSDGIIAPDYTDEALRILKEKKKGNYLILKMDPSYKAPDTEYREVYGVALTEHINDIPLNDTIFNNIVTARRDIPEAALSDLLISLITLKYTLSNSICISYMGQTIGVGAGQQSRVDSVKIAADKADKWLKERNLSGTSGLSLASDAFFPFDDGIYRAAKSGVSFIAQPGGSVRDEEVIRAADKCRMVMAFTGIRLFTH